MTIQNEQHNEQNRKILAIAEQVAAIFGSEWKATHKTFDDGNFYMIRIEGPDSQVLRFGCANWNPTGKINIDGAYPTYRNGRMWDKPYGREYPSINVSINKTAAQIARDIERRLMPEYLEFLALAKSAVDADTAYDDSRNNIANRIAMVIGGVVETKKHDGEMHIQTRGSKIADLYGDIIPYGNEVRFEHFSVSVDEAEAMLRALIACRAKNSE